MKWDRNDPRVLDRLCRSPLGDVLWREITDEQIARVMRGEIVEPTAEQKRNTWRDASAVMVQ